MINFLIDIGSNLGPDFNDLFTNFEAMCEIFFKFTHSKNKLKLIEVDLQTSFGPTWPSKMLAKSSKN